MVLVEVTEQGWLRVWLAAVLVSGAAMDPCPLLSTLQFFSEGPSQPCCVCYIASSEFVSPMIHLI